MTTTRNPHRRPDIRRVRYAHFKRVLPLGPRSKILVRYLPDSPADSVLEGFRGTFGTSSF